MLVNCDITQSVYLSSYILAGIDAIRTMPRPQSVEPFTQTQRIPIIEV